VNFKEAREQNKIAQFVQEREGLPLCRPDPPCDWHNGQRCEPPVRLRQSQIIGRIHLNHLGVNQTRARD